ncbi:MAG TPA: acyclic terpene utilization AtuA family protein [Caulobacteraceae bacterium]|nr:acyclic terpene utilization AtuA family protein [Caulobacteraceae bacterium]
MNVIRVGGASGFWGDSSIAAPQLLGVQDLDYLVFDYLAEITMSILARVRAKDPDAGYATDFVEVIAANLRTLSERGVRVIANAGGVNPLACGRALQSAIDKAGHSLKVGVVVGDDLLPQLDKLRAGGITDMFSGAPLPDHVLSANAYLGAFPIARALDAGADIVVTGRCVDAAVTLGAAIHAFGWKPEDFDRLAGGALAGHIIECGAQATGGIHTDWESTGDWANIGYPIAEVGADGGFVVTKPPSTGGLVSFGTVAEQLVYEIGDPAAYLLPDVTCDFTNVRLEETGADRVRVTGARGLPPTDTYKASLTFADGYRVGAYLTIGGVDAVRKAEKVGEAVVRRCADMLKARNLPSYDETSVEVLGGESFYGPHSRARGSREVVLKLAAKHQQARPLEMMMRELTSSGTSMAPGITIMGGNRPKVSPVVRLFSCLTPKADLVVELQVDGLRRRVPGALSGGYVPRPHVEEPETSLAIADPVKTPLIKLAWARSGDKGDNANIGVIARRPEFLPLIRNALTEAAVANHFAHFLKGRVERFDLPGVCGLNFLLHNVLGGGGVASLRGDPQGKTYAQILLDYPVTVPAALAASLSS